MATGGWNQDDLEKALALIKDHHASFREASQAYGIPKSTLHDHYSGKSNRSKRGPTPYLTECEEQELVDLGSRNGKDWVCADKRTGVYDGEKTFGQRWTTESIC